MIFARASPKKTSMSVNRATPCDQEISRRLRFACDIIGFFKNVFISQGNIQSRNASKLFGVKSQTIQKPFSRQSKYVIQF